MVLVAMGFMPRFVSFCEGPWAAAHRSGLAFWTTLTIGNTFRQETPEFDPWGNYIPL